MKHSFRALPNEWDFRTLHGAQSFLEQLEMTLSLTLNLDIDRLIFLISQIWALKPLHLFKKMPPSRYYSMLSPRGKFSVHLLRHREKQFPKLIT